MGTVPGPGLHGEHGVGLGVWTRQSEPDQQGPTWAAWGMDGGPSGGGLRGRSRKWPNRDGEAREGSPGASTANAQSMGHRRLGVKSREGQWESGQGSRSEQAWELGRLKMPLGVARRGKGAEQNPKLRDLDPLPAAGDGVTKREARLLE